MQKKMERQKVVWFEGMHLDPHHFQQQDRYHQALLNHRIRSISPYDWGLTKLSINKEALENGKFEILQCTGITSDGLAFNIPDENSVPDVRNIQESVSSEKDKIKVFLALPIEQQNGKNCQLNKSSSTDSIRFKTNITKLNDENTGTNENEVIISQPNFQIRFNTESLANFSVIPIAELIRKSDRSFSLNENFIPTCLSISASNRLLSTTSSILEILIGQRVALLDQHRQKLSSQMEFTTADIIPSWLLFSINSFIPLFHHYSSVKNKHPEELFSLMICLTGQLTTFSLDKEIHPQNFPKYDHDNSSQCFNEIEKLIRDLLKVGPSQSYISIPLVKQEETLYIASSVEPSLLLTSQLFLKCSGDIPEDKMINELPQNIKIAAIQDMSHLDEYALKGLTIINVNRPPLGFPSHSNLYYYRIEKSGPKWDSVVKNQSIAIRIPPGFSDIHVELLTMADSK